MSPDWALETLRKHFSQVQTEINVSGVAGETFSLLHKTILKKSTCKLEKNS
jgi:hypothetical protein